MFEFETVDYKLLDETEFNNFSDKLIFQTKEWIDFILNTQNVSPVVVRITEDGAFVGYFTGFIFSKFGIRIVGSPFKGWTTSYMGFNVKDDSNTSRESLVLPLWEWLKKEYKCAYCEIVDRYISREQADKCGFYYQVSETLMLDLTGTEEELLYSYTKHCRKHIRMFERAPVTIESVAPTEAFAQEFYRQLKEVFAYQGLQPPYDLKRIQALFAALDGKQDLLCTRVIENETNKWISSTIGFGYNKHCYTWAATSLRENCNHMQSEGQRWFAIKHWKSRGYVDLDMVGVRGYKLKFNPQKIQVPRIILSRCRALIWGRNLAQKLFWAFNALKGILKK